MDLMKNGFYKNSAQRIDIYNHMRVCSQVLMKEILSDISLENYADKIYEKADSYEWWVDDCLVGLIGIYTNRGNLFPSFITLVSILDKFSSKGIGTKLMDFLIEDLKNNDFVNIELEVKKSNYIAINFYKKIGFAIISEKFQYSYLMELTL